MKHRFSLLSLLPASLLAIATACSPASAPGEPQPADGGAEAAPAQQVTAPPQTAAPSEAPAPQQLTPAIPVDLLSPPAESGGECGIEATEQVPQGAMLTFKYGAPASIEGWALLRGASTAPESVYLKLASNGDASYFVPVEMVSRPGLGIRLGEEALDSAGFRVLAGLDHVPVGEYAVQVAQRIDGRVLLCATGRMAQVVD